MKTKKLFLALICSLVTNLSYASPIKVKCEVVNLNNNIVVASKELHLPDNQEASLIIVSTKNNIQSAEFFSGDIAEGLSRRNDLKGKKFFMVYQNDPDVVALSTGIINKPKFINQNDLVETIVALFPSDAKLIDPVLMIGIRCLRD